jgi:hypothetical protein
VQAGICGRAVDAQENQSRSVLHPTQPAPEKEKRLAPDCDQKQLVYSGQHHNRLMTKENPLCSEATFVGNRSVRCLDLVGPDKRTLRDKYLIGDPHDCPLGTADEMKRKGFVGIYLRHPLVRFRLPNSNLVIQKTW